MMFFPFLPVVVLRVTLPSIFMGVLCLIAALQQKSRPLRTFGAGSLLFAAVTPMLLLPTPPPVRIGAATLYLLSSSLFWLAITDMMGRRRPRHTAWLLATPLAWLCFAIPYGLISHHDSGRVPSIEILFCLVLDDLVVLACIPVLACVSHRSLSHTCLLGVAAVGPAISCLYAAELVRPGYLVPWLVEWTMLPVQMARSMLWPGLAILTVMDMATKRERRLALQDELSELPNRRGFFRAVGDMPERTLLLFDIDHFKRINDTFGHAAGDAAIRRFAHTLSALAGRTAILGRVGGEEFIAALRGAELSTALEVAERIRVAFADSEQALGTGVTVSIGVSPPVSPPVSLGEQMAAADRALYRAKQAGRNRIALAEQPEPPPVRAGGVIEEA